MLVLFFAVNLTAQQTHKNYQKEYEILNIGLDFLEIENVYIRIIPLNPKLVKDAFRKGVQLRGHIKGLGNQYSLQISHVKGLFGKLFILSHELIHLEQMHTGKLVYLTNNSIEFDGKIYKNIEKMDYDSRPWENEAHEKGELLMYKISKQIKLNTKKPLTN